MSVIFGWDASQFDHDRGMRQRHVTAAAQEGIQFFTHKSTELSNGGLVQHQWLGYTMVAARDAGIPFLGSYVVARTGPSAVAQAAAAIKWTKYEAPWLLDHPGFFWQVDLEKWPYDSVSPAVGLALASSLENMTGKKAVLYASRGQYGNSVRGSYPLWNAHYYSAASGLKWDDGYRKLNTASDWEPYSGQTPRILQYTSTAIIGGQHTCDANVFRGSNDDFSEMIGAKKPAPAPKPITVTKVDDLFFCKAKAGHPAPEFENTVYMSDGFKFRVIPSPKPGDTENLPWRAWQTIGAGGGGAVTFDTYEEMCYAAGQRVDN